MNKVAEIIDIALKGVSLAVGIAVVVLPCIGILETDDAVGMLGIGLTCLAITQFSKKD